MKKTLLIAIVAALPLAGCADYYGGGGYGYGYNGPVEGPVGYDGYYDDYYGPIYDGYGGDGGVFYYRNSERGRFRPDRSGHFRHDMNGGQGGFQGQPGGRQHGGQYHPIHGTFTPPPARGGGRHH